MARFQYYNRLNKQQKEIYRRSDAIETILIPETGLFQPDLRKLMLALQEENRVGVRQAVDGIVARVAGQLRIPPARIKILTRRPSNEREELHGLYDPQTHCISVWMRTAQRKQVVAFKTFLRTLLHELCHHLDYTYFKFEDSYHTEGFYKRESSIYKQLLQAHLAVNSD